MTDNSGRLLETFPLELLQAILSSCLDFVSLNSLALAGPLFYRAFLETKPLILHQVLENEFPEDILPHALATLACSRHPTKFRDELPKSLFCDVNLLQASLTLSDALELSKTHIDIKFFAEGFASTLGANPSTGAVDSNPTPLNQHEIYRIQRALYRYEYYCHLWKTGLGYPEDQFERYFNHFAPWENEQFSSVYEYLNYQLSPVFNEVAEHDIEWGEWDVPYEDDGYRCTQQYRDRYLSEGLRYLRKLLTADTYEERHEMMNFPGPEDRFLSNVLGCTYLDDQMQISALSEEDEIHLLPPPFFKDLDIGPKKAWRWAYQNEILPADAYYMSNGQQELRKRGYVFFNYDRLCKWDMFAAPFIPLEEDNSDGRKAQRELSDKKMRESWKKRSLVWQAGGRGWWSETDQSKVVWPPKRAPTFHERLYQLGLERGSTMYPKKG